MACMCLSPISTVEAASSRAEMYGNRKRAQETFLLGSWLPEFLFMNLPFIPIFFDTEDLNIIEAQSL